MRAHGVRSLLDTIVEDTTVYFLITFTRHLVILFEFFVPVSDRLADLCSSTRDKLHIGKDSSPSREVSHRLVYHDKDELDGMLHAQFGNRRDPGGRIISWPGGREVWFPGVRHPLTSWLLRILSIGLAHISKVEYTWNNLCPAGHCQHVGCTTQIIVGCSGDPHNPHAV